MDASLRYVEKKEQGKISEDISPEKLCITKAEEGNHIPYKKEKGITKEEENHKFEKVNEEIKENIYFNKSNEQQCLSIYNKENQKIENENFSGNEDIKNNKMNKNKSTSKIAFVQYKKKKKVYITHLDPAQNIEFFENSKIFRKKKKKKYIIHRRLF